MNLRSNSSKWNISSLVSRITWYKIIEMSKHKKKEIMSNSKHIPAENNGSLDRAT
jgi:hypothetical protein